jgi:hypothetical protein
MPFEIYCRVLSQTLAVLRQHYASADSPIEAPGKADYGDVDFLVAEPLDPSFDAFKTAKKVVAEKLAVLLEAKAFFVESGNPTINLAIPWPRTGKDNLNDEEKYIQIDIHSCPSVKIFRWELFHSAHGDLWNILGSTIRQFGFTVNDRGLFLRIPEIELYDRKKSMIFLTDEPKEILELLGLDESTWWKQFPSREAMFEYAAGCRFFWVKDKVEEGEAVGDVIGDFDGAQEGGAEGKKKLKHNDRQRLSKRPIFAAWIEDFIPTCREQGRFSNKEITREQIRDEILDKYPIKEQYETKLRDWLLVRHKDELWRDVIKGSVPEENVDPAFRAAAIRQLKATIMERDPFDGDIPAASVPNEEGYYDLEAVRDFIEKNWKRAGEIGLVRTQERALQAMRMKAEKKSRLQTEKEHLKVDVYKND